MLLQLRSKQRARPIPNTLGYLCLHLHVYQPPRANAFTGLIPREPTGDQHHDFNEKIFAECYQKLAKAHVFRSISFNVGPTLAQWLEAHHRDIWQLIRKDEQWHRQRYQCSNALAQPYHHTILPLTTGDDGNREIATQIEWGLPHALNHLSRRAYELYESGVREALPVPRAARDGYIGLHDGWLPERAFWQQHGLNHKKPLSGKLIYTTRLLLEAQYFLQQASTSCAWYWERYTSGEVQIVLDAARRAMHLIFQATGVDLQEAFVQDLHQMGGYPQGYLHQPLTAMAPCAFEHNVRPLRM